MKQEVLKHTDAMIRYCPVINDNCRGAYCSSFEATDIHRKSVKFHNKGDLEPIPLAERSGTCSNPNV